MHDSKLPRPLDENLSRADGGEFVSPLQEAVH